MASEKQSGVLVAGEKNHDSADLLGLAGSRTKAFAVGRDSWETIIVEER
jgi:hypothetical protein